MANSRDALKDEVNLLADLEKRASGNPEWEAFFREWRGINEKLIGMSDSGLNDALEEEVQRLKKMRDAIKGDKSMGGQFWTKMLNVDIDAARSLKA